MHFCRVHPARGMVSEIRGADAARQVLNVVDTGHQVWTTIHVATANAILFRLLDMGVPAPAPVKPMVAGINRRHCIAWCRNHGGGDVRYSQVIGSRRPESVWTREHVSGPGRTTL